MFRKRLRFNLKKIDTGCESNTLQNKKYINTDYDNSLDFKI